MAIFATSLDTSTTIVADTFGDIWLVKVNVEVTTTGDAIDGTGSNGSKTFLIHGHLIAQGDGIDLGDSILNNGGNNRVHILSTGSIYALSNAIESAGGGLNLTNEGSLFSIDRTIFAEDGDNTITNAGTITSHNSSGIYATGGNNTISNGGDISARWDGIYASGSGNLIINSGSVISSITSTFNGAVNIWSLFGESNRLVNSGELSGQINAVFGGNGNETVVNRGSTGLFNALYNPPYDRLIEGSRAAFHRALAMFPTPFARAMLRA